MAKLIEIINGSNDPAHPFMVVDGHGIQVDLSNTGGQLWDQKTVRRIVWGMVSSDGKEYGRVELNNGTGRVFWDHELMWPYLKAYDLAVPKLGRS